MWELTIRLVDTSGATLPGRRVTVAFQLRLAGGGAELLMPAESVGVTDPSGALTLSLPSPEGLGDQLKVTVREPDGRVAHEVELPRASVGAELRITVGAPPAPTALQIELSRGAARLGGVDVVVLGRAEGASSFSLVLAGKTDDAGRMQGPYPTGRFVEASAMVRVDGNQTLPIALSAGAFPGRVALALPDLSGVGLAQPVPTPVHTAPVQAAPVQAAPVQAAPAQPAPLPPRSEPPPGDQVPATLEPMPAGATDPDRFEEDDDTHSSTGRRTRRRSSRGPVATVGLSDRVAYALLAVIVLVGGALRLYELGGPSLWNDELSSWRRASYDTIDKVIKKGAGEDVHPPGYYLLLHFVQAINDSEFALRLPSALAGIASLVLVFFLGRRIWSSTEGLIAAGLMAVLWAPIRYSQEARSYSLLMLFAMITIWTWMTLMRDAERKGEFNLEHALWYVLSATGMVYLHYFGVLLVGLQFLGALIFVGSRTRRREALAHVAGTWIAVGLLYLPWMGYFLEDLTQSKSWMDSPDEAEGSTFWFYVKFLFNHQSGVAGFMTVLVVTGAALQLLRNRSSGKGLDFSLRTRWGMVSLWFIMPFAITWLQSVLATPVLSNRNLLISAPAAWLLVGRGITAITPIGRLQAALATIAILVAGATFSGKNYYSKPNRQQYRELVQYVVDHQDETPNDVIIVTGQPQHFNYYLDRLGSTRLADISASSPDDVAKVERLLEEEHPRNVWRLRAGKSADSAVDAWLAERFSMADEQEMYGVSLNLYRKGGGGGGGAGEGAGAGGEAEEVTQTGEEAASDGDAKAEKAEKADKKKKNKNKNKRDQDPEAEDKSPDTGS